jgi:diguanylate cyclase (GGDEF)-like protein
MIRLVLMRVAPRAVWLGFGALLVTCLLIHPFSEPRSSQMVSGAVLIAAFLAGWTCMVLSSRPSAAGTLARFGWSVVGAGAFLLALSQGAWLAPELAPRRFVPLDSCVMAAYLAAIPVLLAGLSLLALAYCPGSGPRPAADAACAIGGLSLLSWYWVLHPLAGFLKGHPSAICVAVAEPAFDLALTFVAFLLLYLPNTPRPVRTLAMGLPLVALGDTLFAHGTFRVFAGLSSGSELPWNSWSELAWALGMSFGALAIFESEPVVSGAKPVAAAASPWSWRATLGVIGVGAVTLAAVSVVLMTEWRVNHHDFDWKVVVVCFAVVAATMAHQLFSMAAHGHVSSQLHGSNMRLEETVAERTRQLQVLHEIVRAATGSLDVNEVLGQILRRTSQALSADATAVWLLEDQGGYAALQLHAQSGFERPEHRALLGAIPPRWGRGLATMLAERRCVPVSCEAKTGEGSEGADDQDSTRAEVWCAPLEWRGKPMGVLGAARWVGGLGKTERGLLEAVALEVAVALQNARLYRLAVDAADHDGVTGLLNHRAIIHQVSIRIKEAARSGQPLAVFLVDLDNFKRINDTHGHLVGDQILKCAATVLQEFCEQGYVAGRYGGDEFILLCPGADAAGARLIADSLKARLKQAEVSRPGGGSLPVSASFGVALYPQMATSQHELLALADVNLYESKAKGTGAIVGLDEPEEEETYTAGSFTVLDALVTAVDKRDHYTRKHSEDVTEYSLMIARELGLSEETMRTLRIAGLLHDLGKIAIPDAILRKPSALTDEEFEVMKQHPVLGYLIVSAIPSLAETLPAIRHHHERWDGRGYPDQLAGEDIPLLGRLMAVPDAFSAMTTDRPYRKGMPVSEALKRLREGSGTQFDPTMVMAFVRALEAAEQGNSEEAPLQQPVWVG